MKKLLFLMLFILVITCKSAYAEVLEISKIIVLEIGKTIPLDISKFKNSAIENETIIKTEEKDKTLKIFPLRRGRTFIYLWDEKNNSNSIEILVVPQGFNNKLNIDERLSKKSADIKDNMKAKINFLGGLSKKNNIDYSWNLGQLFILGNSNLGKYNTFIQFEQKEDLNQLVMASFQLTQKDLFISVGDCWTEISPLTTSYLKYQGAQVNNINLYDTNFSFYTGISGQQFWGSGVWRDTPNKNLFLGVKAKKAVDKNINLFVNAFGVQKNYDNSVIANYLLASVGSEYYSENLLLNAELSASYKTKKAFYAKGVYYDMPLRIQSILNYTEPGYETLSGLTNIDGLQALYNSISYGSWENFTFYGKLNLSKNLNVSENSFILEKGIGVNFYKEKYLPTIDLSYWELDNQVYPYGGVHKGLKINASQHLYYLATQIYGSFSPYSFENSTSTSLNVTNQKIKVGFNTNIFDLAENIIEADNEKEDRDCSNSETTIYRIALNAFRLPEIEIADIGFKFDFSAKYERKYKGESYYSNLKYADAKITVKQDFFDEVYFYYAAYMPNNSYDHQIKFGVKTVVDSGLNLKEKNTAVEGLVFEDRNKNGKKDNNESGLSDFIVKNGENILKTDGNGHYNLIVKGNPFLEFSSEKYSFYEIHSSNPYQIDLNKDNIKLEIPVTFVKNISAVAFFDANSNGIYDKGYDQVIDNVKFYLEEGNVIINTFVASKGVINFELPISSEYLMLTIDLQTVSGSLLPADISLLKQEVTKATKQNSTLYYPFIMK